MHAAFMLVQLFMHISLAFPSDIISFVALAFPADAAGDAASKIATKFTGLATAGAVILVPAGTLGILGGGICLALPVGGNLHKHGWSIIGMSCAGMLVGVMAGTIALVFGS